MSFSNPPLLGNALVVFLKVIDISRTKTKRHIQIWELRKSKSTKLVKVGFKK